MNTKSIIAGVLAGVALFFLGWVLYGILLADTMAGFAGSAKDSMRNPAEVSMLFLAIGNLCGGFLIAFVLGYWAKVSTFLGGAKAGAIIGFLAYASFDFMMYATSNMMVLEGIFIDIAVSTFMYSIAGGIAGWWIGRE
jgi:hypothetical protein